MKFSDHQLSDIIERIYKGVGGFPDMDAEKLLEAHPQAKELFGVYTSAAQRAFFFAKYEALKLGARSIRPEHLLLGILHENDDTLRGAFPAATFHLADLRRQLQKGPFVTHCDTTDISVSEEVASIAQLAIEEAGRTDSLVNTVHLLIALIEGDDPVAARAFRDLRVTADDLREALKGRL